VPQDGTNEGERIGRVFVVGDQVFQVDVMRGQQPVDRAKADAVFKSIKLTQ
jgi:hypothetical protein